MRADARLSEVVIEGAQLELVESCVYRLVEEPRPTNESDSAFGWVYDVVA